MTHAGKEPAEDTKRAISNTLCLCRVNDSDYVLLALFPRQPGDGENSCMTKTINAKAQRREDRKEMPIFLFLRAFEPLRLCVKRNYFGFPSSDDNFSSAFDKSAGFVSGVGAGVAGHFGHRRQLFLVHFWHRPPARRALVWRRAARPVAAAPVSPEFSPPPAVPPRPPANRPHPRADCAPLVSAAAARAFCTTSRK